MVHALNRAVDGGEPKTARQGHWTQTGVELQVNSYLMSPGPSALLSIIAYWTVSNRDTPHLEDHACIPDAGVNLKCGKSQLLCLPQAMQSALNKQTKTCGSVIKGTAGMNLGSVTAWQQIQGRLEDHMKGVLDKVHSPPIALRCPIVAPLAARVKINVHTIYMPIDSYKQVFLGKLVSEIGTLNFYHCGSYDDILICWNEMLNCWKGNYEKLFWKEIMRNYLILFCPGSYAFSLP